MDTATKLLQLVALLAEQFRSLLLVKSCLEQRMPDKVVLEQTKWSSGRLFMAKKNAARFSTGVLRDVLQKLEFLDIEAKTSVAPTRVILDLILSQVV